MSGVHEASSPGSHGGDPLGPVAAGSLADPRLTTRRVRMGDYAFEVVCQSYLLADTTTNVSVFSISSQWFCSESLKKFSCFSILLPCV